MLSDHFSSLVCVLNHLLKIHYQALFLIGHSLDLILLQCFQFHFPFVIPSIRFNSVFNHQLISINFLGIFLVNIKPPKDQKHHKSSQKTKNITKHYTQRIKKQTPRYIQYTSLQQFTNPGWQLNELSLGD